jgi:hypothetical protein
MVVHEKVKETEEPVTTHSGDKEEPNVLSSIPLFSNLGPTDEESKLTPQAQSFLTDNRQEDQNRLLDHEHWRLTPSQVRFQSPPTPELRKSSPAKLTSKPVSGYQTARFQQTSET